MTATTFWGLLIGADGYFPNLLSNGASYRSLGGCVSDVHRVKAMLERRLIDRAPVLSMLVAAAGSDGRPTGDEASWPTAANIRRALEEVAARAQPGDQVYVHYSGHGGRVVSAWKDLKGHYGVDEALVPIDIGLPDNDDGPIHTRPERYIRDVELALYLDRLARKGDAGGRPITVTLVFDSCHSGGATRSCSDLAKRSATGGSGGLRDAHGMIDQRELIEILYPARERAAMVEAFGRLRGATERAVAPAVTWLPPARGYVLLAGCRDVETALEGSFDGRPSGGVLTDALLDALHCLGAEQSWKTVYARVLACVQLRVASQTPQLLGDIDRHVFGTELEPVEHTFAVSAIDPARRRVTLNAGLALTITRGVEFDIYKPGTTDFSLSAPRVARATVFEATASASRAQLDDDVDPRTIQVGAPAVIRALALRRKVELFARADLPEPVKRRQAGVLAALADAIRIDGGGFLEVCPAGALPHYQVALSCDGRIEICDPQGVTLEYLEPEVRIDDSHAMRVVVGQLRRLSRYHSVLAMEQPGSVLRDQLQVELLAAPPGWNDRQSIQIECGTPLARQADAYTVPNYTWIWLRLTNKEPRVALNIALLDLSRRWEVELVIPNPHELCGARYETVGDRPRVFAFKMFTPVGAVIDILKLFVSTEDVDFPALATSAAHNRTTTRGDSSALGRLIDAINATEHRTRDVCSGTSRSSTWTVREFRIRTLP